MLSVGTLLIGSASRRASAGNGVARGISTSRLLLITAGEIGSCTSHSNPGFPNAVRWPQRPRSYLPTAGHRSPPFTDASCPHSVDDFRRIVAGETERPSRAEHVPPSRDCARAAAAHGDIDLVHCSARGRRKVVRGRPPELGAVPAPTHGRDGETRGPYSGRGPAPTPSRAGSALGHAPSEAPRKPVTSGVSLLAPRNLGKKSRGRRAGGDPVLSAHDVIGFDRNRRSASAEIRRFWRRDDRFGQRVNARVAPFSD